MNKCIKIIVQDAMGHNCRAALLAHLSRKHATNGWVYLAFSHNPANTIDKTAPGMTKVIRGKVRGHEWVDEQVLFEEYDSLKVSGGTCWGCRLLFDKQG